MRELSDYERGYIEAFLDTDGTLGAYMGYQQYKNSLSPNLAIRIDFINTDIKILEKVIEIIGPGRISENENNGNFKSTKPIFRLMYTIKVADWLLPQLELVIKDDKRRAIMEVIKKHKSTKDWGEKYKGIVKTMHNAGWAIKKSGNIKKDFPDWTNKRPTIPRGQDGRFQKMN